MARFLDGFPKALCLRFIDVLKVLRILRISALPAMENGVSIIILMMLKRALGLYVSGINILTISVYPAHAAIWIGVSPSLSGALHYGQS